MSTAEPKAVDVMPSVGHAVRSAMEQAPLIAIAIALIWMRLDTTDANLAGVSAAVQSLSADVRVAAVQTQNDATALQRDLDDLDDRVRALENER
jgi:hypothetical protein